MPAAHTDSRQLRGIRSLRLLSEYITSLLLWILFIHHFRVAAVVHFPDVLRSFRAELADVELMLSVAPSRALLDDLAGGRLDLVVCVEPPEPLAGIETVSLLSETLAVYAPPGTTIGEPHDWGPWVLFPSDSHTRRAVSERLIERGAPLDIAAESHQPDVLREMVQLGIGWTVLPRTQGEVAQTDLVVGEKLLERKLVLARRSKSVHDPAADDLAARLRRRTDTTWSDAT